jgi:ABC-type multidrug transport system ATPase subunit
MSENLPVEAGAGLDFVGVGLTVGEGVRLLQDVSLSLQGAGGLVAILGPSGCGKSTFLKVVAGILGHTEGKVVWRGTELGDDADFDAGEVGYVPQFSIAHEGLTVGECFEDAMRIRGLAVAGNPDSVEAIATRVGLDVSRRISVLSGGQRRRLALGLELMSEPEILMCDEVTSGLDPRSEEEVVGLLRQESARGRLVLNVTHSLRHLALHDEVVVLCAGRLVYHGAPSLMGHYFGISDMEELYPRLGMRTPEEWADSWARKREGYVVASRTHAGAPPAVVERCVGGFREQASVVFWRRLRLLMRDRGALGLQAAMVFGFPVLVLMFALDGIPGLAAFNERFGGADIARQLASDLESTASYMRVGSLVSGLILFQVVLLSLMGANNAAREVSGERLIFEKERFSGLRPEAYLAGKSAFVAMLSLVQSLWMAIFLGMFVGLPGDWVAQAMLLVLANFAMGMVALGVSALMRTPEQSSLLTVYLVGFQLPLSGAVLAMPDWLGRLSRPFIEGYWAWAGFVQTFHDMRHFDAVLKTTTTPVCSVSAAVGVLVFHVCAGFLLALAGARRSHWD